MRIFVFGSSITSCYWNGAATYYRGIYKNLAALGHEITFAEPDIYGRQQNRDRHEVNYADVIVYRTPGDIDGLLAQAAEAHAASEDTALAHAAASNVGWPVEGSAPS